MNRADPVDVYVINADGTEQRLITAHAHAFSYPVWSPDGKYIAFHSYGEKGQRAGSRP
jgi:Tol biopolymer transport system component